MTQNIEKRNIKISRERGQGWDWKNRKKNAEYKREEIKNKWIQADTEHRTEKERK